MLSIIQQKLFLERKLQRKCKNQSIKTHVCFIHLGYMFTLYRIVKRSVAESVPDRASVHTRNAAFEAVSAPEQYCSAAAVESVTFRIG